MGGWRRKNEGKQEKEQQEEEKEREWEMRESKLGVIDQLVYSKG